jgi:predicted ArsR family transcriptional regulator
MKSPANQVTHEAGFTIHEFLNLPDDERHILTWMQRQKVCSLGAIVKFLGQTEEQVRGFLQELQRQGFIEEIATHPECLYQVNLISMRHQRFKRERPSIFDQLFEES